MSDKPLSLLSHESTEGSSSESSADYTTSTEVRVTNKSNWLIKFVIWTTLSLGVGFGIGLPTGLALSEQPDCCHDGTSDPKRKQIQPDGYH